MKSILHKINKAFKLLKCKFSSSYSEFYYTKRAREKLQIHGEGLRVAGKIEVSDWRQLVIGKNVVIGKNCHFLSEGGIYIADNVRIGDNVIIDTRKEGFNISNLGSDTVDNLSPVFIDSDKTILKGTFLGADFSGNYEEVSFHSSEGINRFFIVSTGRSGTNALAETLNQHEKISCKHEPKHVMNRLSTEYAHKLKSEDAVLFELKFVFLKCAPDNPNNLLIGESDWKYSNLILLLHKIFPKAKFVWLIRNASDFINSAHGRGWFDDYEYNYPFRKIYSHDLIADKRQFNFYQLEYSIYRINGYKSGDFDKEEWENMTSFERCCWFWYRWNKIIESQLLQIDRILWLRINLEDLEHKMDNLMKFLNLHSPSIPVVHSNKAYYLKMETESWNESQKEAYSEWCKLSMKEYYKTT